MKKPPSAERVDKVSRLINAAIDEYNFKYTALALRLLGDTRDEQVLCEQALTAGSEALENYRYSRSTFHDAGNGFAVTIQSQYVELSYRLEESTAFLEELG